MNIQTKRYKIRKRQSEKSWEINHIYYLFYAQEKCSWYQQQYSNCNRQNTKERNERFIYTQFVHYFDRFGIVPIIERVPSMLETQRHRNDQQRQRNYILYHFRIQLFRIQPPTSAMGIPIAALCRALLALLGYWFLCLKYRKKPMGGRALETMNQNLDSLSLLFFILLYFFKFHCFTQ